MPVEFEDVAALKTRSEDNKKAPVEQRSYLALELIADALILTLEQELDEELEDEEYEEEEAGEEGEEEAPGRD